MVSGAFPTTGFYVRLFQNQHLLLCNCVKRPPNSQTGAVIKIPAKKVVKALPAKALKDIIAAKKKQNR